MHYPMTTNVWSNYFEDVPGDINNYDQYIPLETAEYLMLNQQFDPQWQAHVAGIIQRVEATFAVPSFGANSINEQIDYPIAMGSHTSRYAKVLALRSELTGDASKRRPHHPPSARLPGRIRSPMEPAQKTRQRIRPAQQSARQPATDLPETGQK